MMCGRCSSRCNGLQSGHWERSRSNTATPWIAQSARIATRTSTTSRAVKHAPARGQSARRAGASGSSWCRNTEVPAGTSTRSARVAVRPCRYRTITGSGSLICRRLHGTRSGRSTRSLIGVRSTRSWKRSRSRQRRAIAGPAPGTFRRAGMRPLWFLASVPH